LSGWATIKNGTSEIPPEKKIK